MKHGHEHWYGHVDTMMPKIIGHEIDEVWKPIIICSFRCDYEIYKDREFQSISEIMLHDWMRYKDHRDDHNNLNIYYTFDNRESIPTVTFGKKIEYIMKSRITSKTCKRNK